MYRAVVVASVLLVSQSIVHAQFAGDVQKMANDLKQIGLAYHNYHDATQKAPIKALDLAPYLENDKRLLTVLMDNIVFIYGVRITEMIDGTSNTILAYFKDVPEKGGLVLMGDGSVRRLQAEEFKKSILAKPKGK